MNKNVLCLLLTVFLAAACGQGKGPGMHNGGGSPPTPGPDNDIVFTDCEVVEIDKCPKENSGNPPVKIHITGGPSPDINITPKKVCPDQGEVVHFDITGPAGGPHMIKPGSVTVFPKKFASSWLTGTNSADKNEIEILVPGFVADDTDHDYLVVTSSGVCVDPRVHVR